MKVILIFIKFELNCFNLSKPKFDYFIIKKEENKLCILWKGIYH